MRMHVTAVEQCLTFRKYLINADSDSGYRVVGMLWFWKGRLLSPEVKFRVIVWQNRFWVMAGEPYPGTRELSLSSRFLWLAIGLGMAMIQHAGYWDANGHLAETSGRSFVFLIQKKREDDLLAWDLVMMVGGAAAILWPWGHSRRPTC